MARPTNKQRIQRRIDEALTVGKLRELLAQYPDDMPLGRMGHFGEALLVSERSVRKTQGYVTPDEWDWRSDVSKTVDMLEITFPDRGPDPD